MTPSLQHYKRYYADAWSKKHLKYAINSYPSNARDLKEQQRVDREIAMAFKVHFKCKI